MPILTRSEWIEEYGGTRQNISQLVKAGTLASYMGSTKLDTEDPTNKAWIQNPETRAHNSSQQKPAANEQPQGDHDSETLEGYRKEYVKQQGLKLSMQNKKERNLLISNEEVNNFLSTLRQIDESFFKNLGQNVTPSIMSIGKINDGSLSILIQAKIEEFVYKILDQRRDLIDNFIQERPIEDE